MQFETPDFYCAQVQSHSLDLELELELESFIFHRKIFLH